MEGMEEGNVDGIFMGGLFGGELAVVETVPLLPVPFYPDRRLSLSWVVVVDWPRLGCLAQTVGFTGGVPVLKNGPMSSGPDTLDCLAAGRNIHCVQFPF